MNFSELTIKLIFLVLPGMICWFFMEKLIISKKRDNFHFMVYSLMLGFLSYVVYGLVVLRDLGKVKFFNSLVAITNGSNTENLVDLKEISLVSGMAILVAIVLSFIINKQIFHRIMQKLHISKRFSEPDLWASLFINKHNKIAEVRDFKNELVYSGRIKGFSDTADTKIELYLINVIVYNFSNEELYKESEMYLSRDSSDITIEFPRIKEDN